MAPGRSPPRNLGQGPRFGGLRKREEQPMRRGARNASAKGRCILAPVSLAKEPVRYFGPNPPIRSGLYQTLPKPKSKVCLVHSSPRARELGGPATRARGAARRVFFAQRREKGEA